MKALEDRVILTVGEMMLDRALTLDVDQHQTIALWALKTAMVMEHVSRHKTIFYTDEERAEVKHRLDPTDTAVWLGRSVGNVNFYTRGNDLSSDGQGGGLQAYVTTFTDGRLVLQVVTLRRQRFLGSLSFPTANRWRPFTVRIWPNVTTPVQWPPDGGTILEQGLDAFHRRFGEASQ